MIESRKKIADIIHAGADEIIFTSSATEANNFALKGVVWASNAKKKHLVVSAAEHACVLASAEWLKTQSVDVTVLPVNEFGMVSSVDIKKAIKKDTLLVSVMHANNEVGTINSIADIGRICREKKVLFHTDAAQTFGTLPIDVNRMSIDLLTASSHKIYGPKGVGFLYVRRGVQITPLLHGGGQEFGLRSSSVNISGVVGFAKAAEILHKNNKTENKRLTELRDFLITGVLASIEQVELGGHPNKRLPNNVHFIFTGVNSEQLVLELDKNGIAVSNGSACLSLKEEYSYVVFACGKGKKKSSEAVRFSLGKNTNKKDIEYVLVVLPKVIKKLRKLS